MKSHRGLSAVIGTVFLIAIVVGALSYVSYSLEMMGNFSESLIVEESRQKNKQAESIEIVSIDLTGDKLDGVIKNTGEIPVQLNTLWIDEQGVNDVVQKYILDAQISPGKTINLISLVDVDMYSTKGYNMKVVSSRGDVNSFYVNSASQENIDIKMIAIPETIVTKFDATLLMTVVNNMSNNNILVNLTPTDPYPGCSADIDCTLVSGPDPASYDVLKSGDIAIFKWSYQLSGDKSDTFSFTGAVQNGNPGNDDTTIVTIDVPVYAEESGVSLQSLGFGSTSTLSDVLIMHDEIYGIPAGVDYQLSPLAAESSAATSLTFDDVSDSWQFFSSNVTATDAHFPAGNWNASMRYYHDHIPSGLGSGSEKMWQNGQNGGMNLHFEDISPSTGMYDSGEDSTCYNLATTGQTAVVGAVHSTTMGVNGSGAYYFDGVNDHIRYETANDYSCNNPVDKNFSLVMWFKADVQPTYHTRQALYWIWNSNDGGGIRIEIGDGTSGNHGQLFFRVIDREGDNTVCYGDEPDGNGGENYMDGNWHHVAATYEISSGKCNFYLDGNSVDYVNSQASGELEWGNSEDVYIGNSESSDSDFSGYIDDILFWRDYVLVQNDVDILSDHSFGYNSTNMHFTISTYTDTGVLSNQIVYSNDYGLKWGDQGHYTDERDEYRGGNYTVSLPQVQLNINPDKNRLGFTMSYASGESLYMIIDDSDLDGTETVEYDLSTYLQPTTLISPQVLPAFHVWDNDDSKVTFFTYNAGDEGSWFTDQGTRIIFSGAAGNYAGLVDSISYGGDTVIMDYDKDSPFVPRDTQADIIFWPPQKTPNKSEPADDDDRIDAGVYDVDVFLNGYDEDGTIFLRSIDLGTVTVLE